MHARFYLPLMGRFSSVDPIGGNPFAPQSWNRYSYVMGNPMNFIDPWGLTGEPANQDDAIDIGYVDRVDVVAEWSPPPFSGGFGVPPLAIAADLYLGLRLGHPYYATRGLVLQLNADATQAMRSFHPFRLADPNGPCTQAFFGSLESFLDCFVAAFPVGSVRLAPTRSPLLLGPGIRFGAKIEAQLGKRGWTKGDVQTAVDKPIRTVTTRDTRHLAGGLRVDDPATAFYSPGGGYVVRNNRTGDIVQVSNRFDPKWRAPWDQ